MESVDVCLMDDIIVIKWDWLVVIIVVMRFCNLLINVYKFKNDNKYYVN